jgi:signal transduction histidine kinase
MFGKLQSSNKQNQQGIGLGLNVCKRIINVYNGEITISSELGVGSTFSFTFEVVDFEMFPPQE